MIIFEDSADCRRFLDYLDREIREKSIAVLAWCLMSNHVHLLIVDEKQEIGEAMRRLASCYARYFNNRHDHQGHVFLSRYFSKPIEDDNHLLSAARYIMRNPVKAKIGTLETYPWTSYGEYLATPLRCEIGMLLDMLGGIDGFKAFMRIADDSYDPFGSDSAAEDALRARGRAVLSDADWKSISSGDRAKRDAAIGKLKLAGLSIRQAQRVVGLGRSIIERAYAKQDL